MEMGFGFLFRVDDSCIGKHLGERDPSNQEISTNKIRRTDQYEINHGKQDGEVETDAWMLNRDKSYENEPLHELEKLGIFPNRSQREMIQKNQGFEESTNGTAKASNVDVSPKLSQNGQLSSAKREGKNPKLSAKDRRMLKKLRMQGVDQAEANVLVQQAKNQENRESSAFKQTEVKKCEKEKEQNHVRGKKGKLKKAKKYRDQDDEEKAIRLEALGHYEEANKLKSKIEEESLQQNKKQEEESSGLENTEDVLEDALEDVQESEQKKLEIPTENGFHEHMNEIEEDNVAHTNVLEMKDIDANEMKPSRPSRAERRAVRTREEEEIRKLKEEENIIDANPEDLGSEGYLNALTGQPLEDDVILFCIPVCAPYSAMHYFKYKVKLTPGSSKKGKSSKVAISLFTSMPECTQREKELIRAVHDNELVAVILGNVKVTAPGLAQQKIKNKKGNKKVKQEPVF